MTVHAQALKIRNKQEYDLMIQSIELFENSKIQIDDLISELERRISAIDEEDDAWKATVHENWADLEVARAIALSEDRTMLNEHETNIVFGAVGRLRELVLEKIEARASDGRGPEASPSRR